MLNGVQGKNTDKSISFMVFRTGSVLIVGKCNECELKMIYEYIKNILIKQHSRIAVETNEKKYENIAWRLGKAKIVVFQNRSQKKFLISKYFWLKKKAPPPTKRNNEPEKTNIKHNSK